MSTMTLFDLGSMLTRSDILLTLACTARYKPI